METGGGSSESPVEPKKGKSKIPRKAKESLLKQSYSLSLSLFLSPYMQHTRMCKFDGDDLFGICLVWAESPAEFFAENKNIAGFDNVSFKFRTLMRAYLLTNWAILP